jgi:hypothetical protein
MTDLAALVGHLAIAEGLLPELFASLACLGACSCPGGREHTSHVPHLNDRHVAVLQLLAALVGEVQPSQLPLPPRLALLSLECEAAREEGSWAGAAIFPVARGYTEGDGRVR